MGPWALEPGPRTPVATNWVPGNPRCRSARNGMEPPSPTKPGSRPKRSLDTAESVAAMPGSSGGAIHPWAAASMSMVMCAPSSVRMAEIRASVATCASTSGGSRSENFSVVEGRRTFPPSRGLGSPSAPVTSRAAPQVRATSRSTGSGVRRCRPSTIGRAAVGELGRHGGEVGPVRVGYPRPEQFRQEDAAGRLVLYLRQDAAQDAERGRDHATALPAVDALGQHVDLHRGDDVAPQRRRQPQAVVAEPARIEADDETGRADALLEVLDVRRQVGAAALLARLNEHEHAALAAARRHQTRHGGKRRVAVVRGAAPVEEVALAHRLPGPEPAAPLAERRLLVHVAVDEDGIAGAAVVDQQHGGAARQRHDLHLERGVLVVRPLRQQLGRRRDGAPLVPVRVEGGGEARDARVLAQGGEDAVLPGGVDVDHGCVTFRRSR